ncbi:MAG: gamma-glutamyltransferase family protein [Actinomycetes bacterium]
MRQRGVVATVDRLATEAGIDALQAGGNAADAAVAASAVLAVTTQHLCGMGGDLIAVVHPGRGKDVPTALLSIGRAGSGADPATLFAEGHRMIPFRDDVRAVTVPGCVDGWLALHSRYGRLPLGEVLAAATAYAEEGFPVAPLLAMSLPSVEYVVGSEDFFVGGAPQAGDLRRRPGIARSLRAIVDRGRDGWYGGDFGAGLLRIGQGWFAPPDLERDLAEWTETLSVEIPSGLLHVTPAPTQGYLTALGAAVAARLPVPPTDDDPLWPHLLIEAARAAGHDRNALLYDGADVFRLLSVDEIARRTALVDPERSSVPAGPAHAGDTIYLCTADSEGMCVSLSQSNASGFGANVTVPEIGVFLHNRGIGFALHDDLPGVLAPRKRPIHTLAPFLVTSGSGEPRTVGGTMGGDAQPQICLQLLARLQAGASASEAVDAPRWEIAEEGGSGFGTWTRDKNGNLRQVIYVEDTSPASWDDGLRARGHVVQRIPMSSAFGHAQLALVAEDGSLTAAADPRALTGAALSCPA